MALPRGLRAAPAAPLRLAAIDWAMLDTAVALGHMPVAAAELRRFRADAGGPQLPADLVDLGLRGAPNYELLQLTRPDLILTSPFYDGYADRLRTIAPVLSLPVYLPGQPPLPRAVQAVRDLARRIGDLPAGDRALDRAKGDLDRARARLAPVARRPLALVEIGDARHLRVFGHDSLFGSTLPRLGLTNAWTGTSAFSFLAPVPLERLADMPDAALVIIGPVPPEAARGLSRSRLWRALPQIRAGHVHRLDRVNAYGGVLAACRFAGLLAGALAGGALAGGDRA